MIATFIFFLICFAIIGVSSSKHSLHTKNDYYLATNQVKPWLVGLSAVATNNSGYMFIGVIGYTYTTGLASIWLMIGWILGDFLASLYVHKRLRIATQHSKQISYAGLLSHWYGQNHTLVQRLVAIITLFFLVVYAAAQLIAGSKALQVLLHWPSWSGAVVGAVIVCVYCIAGGIRASIWTDAAQSFVMIFAMALLLSMGVIDLGGVQSVISQMQQIPSYMDWLPKDLVFPGLAGGLLFIVSWLFAGFSVIGQPHIMVRFMMLDNASNIRNAKYWYYLWFISFYCMATMVGLLSRLYLPETSLFDAELALPTMAQQILPPMFVGLILAGVFAATMSTADSLILSCSSAVTLDLFPKLLKKQWHLKATTIIITAIALILAILNTQSVFNMVIMAWSGLASAFAPLLLMLCFNKRPSQAICVIAILAGFFTALAWRYFDLHSFIYEGLIGILVGLFVFWFTDLSHKFTLNK